MAGIRTYIARHHIGLLALMLVVAGGSAYAAGVAKNSVGSKQIRNGQVRSPDVANGNLTGRDLKAGAVRESDLAAGAASTRVIGDGSVGEAELATGAVSAPKLAPDSVDGSRIADASIGTADLDPGSVADVISSSGTHPADGSLTEVLSIEGFGTLELQCSPPDSHGVAFTLNGPLKQRVEIAAHDAFDYAPSGINSAHKTTGSVGVSGSGLSRLEGVLHSFTDERVLRIDFYQAIDSDCVYRVAATLDRNDA